MTHKEAEREIPFFLNDSINNVQLDDFLDHIDHCSECKEELTIQFIIGTGIQRLEAGDTFNLMGELNAKIEKARERLSSTYHLIHFSWILQAIVLVETIILFFLTWRLWEF